MKRANVIAVLVGLAAIVVLTTDASAMYNPATGNFLQRDPGPNGPMRVGTSGPAMRGSFMPTDQLKGEKQDDLEEEHDDLNLSQYRDGMNLYQYVLSNPVTRTDPSGLQANPPGGQLLKPVQVSLQLAAAGATLIGNVQACNQCALTEPKGTTDATWIAPPPIGPLPVYIGQVFIVWPYTTTVTWTPTCARRNCGQLYALVFYKMPGKNGASGFAYTRCR